MNKNEHNFESLKRLDYDSAYQIESLKADSLLFERNRSRITLNNNWKFTVDPYEVGLRKQGYEENFLDSKGLAVPLDFIPDDWEDIESIQNWNFIDDRYYLYEGSGWYFKSFDLDDWSDSEAYFLRIGAANYETRVWLNGNYAGRHIGGFSPFNMDLSEYIREANNRLLIWVNNTRKLEGIPSLHTDWFNYGGLYRGVELLRIPKENYIHDFHTYLEQDGTFHTIKVSIRLKGDFDDVLFSIPELGVRQLIPVDLQTGYAHATIEANVELWDVEHPKLYEVIVEYAHDQVIDYVGYREFRTEGNKLVLNGKHIYLRGICFHAESEENGRALTEDEMRENFRLAKDLNCNFVRLAHYPHDEKMARIADEEGILVWEEIPVYWALTFNNQETYENAENQMSELVYRDRNRASVIMWSVGNENPDTDDRLHFMTRLVEVCKQLDPTRPVTAACLLDMNELAITDRLKDIVDIVSINEYIGWYHRDYQKLDTFIANFSLTKPFIISEFGADAKKDYYGAKDEIFTENMQKEFYENQIRYFSQMDFLSGTCPWILYDFRSPKRINKYQEHYNLKGLLTKDKKEKKMAYDVMKDYYQALKSKEDNGSEIHYKKKI